MWTTPERIALLQKSVGDDADQQGNDLPTVGATVIVDSPFAREDRPSETVPPVMGPVKLHRARAQKLVRGERARSSLQIARSAFEELRNSPAVPSKMVSMNSKNNRSSRAPGSSLGVVALVLVAAVIAVLNRPTKVSKASDSSAAGPDRRHGDPGQTTAG